MGGSVGMDDNRRRHHDLWCGEEDSRTMTYSERRFWRVWLPLAIVGAVGVLAAGLTETRINGLWLASMTVAVTSQCLMVREIKAFETKKD